MRAALLAALLVGGAVFSAAPRDDSPLSDLLDTYGIAAQPPMPADLLNLPVKDGELSADDRELAVAFWQMKDDRYQTLHVVVADRASGAWKHASFPEGMAGSDPDLATGSVTQLDRSPHFVAVGMHLNPSAMSTWIFNRDLKRVRSVYGWVQTILPNELVLYEHSQIHFAPTHYARLSILDPASGKEAQVYPPQPPDPIRSTFMTRVKARWDSLGGETWLAAQNHHGDPALFDNSVTPPLIDWTTHAAAFRAHYGDDRGDTAAKTELKDEALVVCGGLDRIETARCRETAFADWQKRYPGQPDEVILKQAAGAAVAAQPAAEAPKRDYPIKAVPLTRVVVTDDFWRPKMDTNRTVTIPHIMRQNEITGRVDNFLKAAHKLEGPYKGQRYNDTDIYKVIEAASYSLAAKPDPALDRKIDELIAIVAAAQEPDGYLYTARTIDPAHPAPGAGPERWSWLHTSHELYDQGHMYEAAVAHFQATGKRTLLDVAIKSADLVCRTFGPDARHDVPGHEEIELALVKLYRVTGNQRYLDTARFFLLNRGLPHTDPPAPFAPGDRFAIYNDLKYRQDDKPVMEETQAVGHAVRATYLYSGMTDAAVLFGDSGLGRTVDALWQDVTSKRMYLTGGLGSVGRTEAFGDDYVLPNRAYAETCASVGGMLWYHRMFLREGKASYYDTFERTLYNGFLSGVSLAGDSFFYQNPLVSNGSVERSQYFDVACCPANLARLIGELPGLIYAQQGKTIFVNLFVSSRTDLNVAGSKVALSQESRYPWSGDVTIHVDALKPATFAVNVRIPSWSRGEAMPEGDLYRFAPNSSAAPPAIRVNGKPIALESAMTASGYARIERLWKRGDTITLSLPMPVRRVLANDAVAEDKGKAAIQRGPIVYALEGVDNGGKVDDLSIPLATPLEHHFDPSVLGGVEVVTGTVGNRTVTAIPYYAWNNRGKGQMMVWAPY